MQNKTVSIIMNCYNGQDFLRESINSVINQTYKKWELIFYDNCSTDRSAQIVKKYKDRRIKYFKSKKNLNLGLARKTALSKANGYFVAFLDTDDIWIKNKLKTQLKFLEKKEIGFCISNSLFFNKFKSKNFYPKKKYFNKKVFYELIENYFISFDTVIIKSKYLKKLNHAIDGRFNIIHDNFVKIDALRYTYPNRFRKSFFSSKSFCIAISPINLIITFFYFAFIK